MLMPEVYKAEETVRTNLAVNHGRDLSRVVLRVEAQCVSGSDGLSKSEVNYLEYIRRCFSVGVEFAKHCRMKSIIDGRRNFGRNAPVSLGIDQQHPCGAIEFMQILSNSQLF